MFFEHIENTFDFRTERQEALLPGSHQLFPLLWIGWCNDDGAVVLPDVFTHHSRTVERIANCDPRLLIENLWYLLGVTMASRSKRQSAQLPVRINAHMEFEPIVPALMVFAEIGNVSAYFMAIGSVTLADWQHGGIHQAARRSVTIVEEGWDSSAEVDGNVQGTHCTLVVVEILPDGSAGLMRRDL